MLPDPLLIDHMIRGCEQGDGADLGPAVALAIQYTSAALSACSCAAI